MALNQRLFPPSFWEALVKVLIHSIDSKSSKEITKLGAFLRAIERFPKHSTKSNYHLQMVQKKPRSQYWEIDIRVWPDYIEISCNEIEKYFDGDWTVLSGFRKSTAGIDENSFSRKCILLDDDLYKAITTTLVADEPNWDCQISKN